MDGQGQRWGQSDRRLDITLSKPEPGDEPGPILIDLHTSPDYRWLVADFAYVGSQLVDLSSGKLQSLVSDSSMSSWSFLAWTPDSRRILISSRDGVRLLDLATTISETIDFPKDEYGSYLQAAAYSPDGKYLADAVIYPAVYAVREIEMTEIGLRNVENGERKSIAQISGGMQVIDHSLKWSPDGQKIIWIVNAGDTKSAQVGLANLQTQLWMTDLKKNNTKMIGILGEAVEYSHQAVWSPDGRHIAFVKVEGVNEGKDAAGNIYLVDLESGAEQQLNHFTNQRLSHLEWSPDGQRIAFSTFVGDHSEIRMTDLNGVKQLPIAGPAISDAPFVWLAQ